jgi:hypothetical protein
VLVAMYSRLSSPIKKKKQKKAAVVLTLW